MDIRQTSKNTGSVPPYHLTSFFMREMLFASDYTPRSDWKSPSLIIPATRIADTIVVTAITTLVTVLISWKQLQATAIKKDNNAQRMNAVGIL
ncbi:hypothetical protein BD310DRAFT_941846 [Dichomitus squalens]|uniref:Uncharacterized protein n=1 Tax=Dichomitus squalens TaxID=114155 RepID=A0A4Q9PC96_9APHY|nr:hypothetical protein BD310DRAFT_941846 [Dichomitus squalens]